MSVRVWGDPKASHRPHASVVMLCEGEMPESLDRNACCPACGEPAEWFATVVCPNDAHRQANHPLHWYYTCDACLRKAREAATNGQLTRCHGEAPQFRARSLARRAS